MTLTDAMNDVWRLRLVVSALDKSIVITPVRMKSTKLHSMHSSLFHAPNRHNLMFQKLSLKAGTFPPNLVSGGTAH